MKFVSSLDRVPGRQTFENFPNVAANHSTDIRDSIRGSPRRGGSYVIFERSEKVEEMKPKGGLKGD